MTFALRPSTRDLFLAQASAGESPRGAATARLPNMVDALNGLAPHRERPVVVGIDGHGGAGKTTLARALSDALGAQVVHTDDFAGFEGAAGWHLELVERVLRPAADGAGALSYRPASRWPGHEPDPVIDLPVTPVVILEGVTSLRRELRPWIDLGVFVDAPRELCLARGLERDAALEPDRAALEALWRAWLSGEDEYFADHEPARHARFVVDGAAPLGGGDAFLGQAISRPPSGSNQHSLDASTPSDARSPTAPTRPGNRAVTGAPDSSKRR